MSGFQAAPFPFSYWSTEVQVSQPSLGKKARGEFGLYTFHLAGREKYFQILHSDLLQIISQSGLYPHFWTRARAHIP